MLERRWKHGKIEEWNLLGVFEILKECSDLDSLMTVPNEHGFNVLQAAVVLDDVEFIELLLGESCSVNQGQCSLPLHLACHLGNVTMVEYLLRNGADRNLEIGMCYPKPHQPIKHVPSRFHFLENNIYLCDSNHQLPLMFAIKNDHVDIVKLLLLGNKGYDHYWPYHRLPLHVACKHGAFRCIRYLARLRPSYVNELDEDGLTPLLHAVPWGKVYVQFLEEMGANVKVLTMKRQNSLHLLYSNIKNPKDLYATTKFLLGTGLEQDVSVTDNKGNTALHDLIALVNRKVQSFTELKESVEQEEVDQNVLQTIEIVLRNNCDPNIKNNVGVTALHKLILMFDIVTNSDPAGISVDTLPNRENYKADFNVLCQTLDILLSNNAQPNLLSGAGRTPLVMMLQIVLNVDTTKIREYHDGLLKCISLLCHHKANPSLNVATHISIVTCLSKIGQKCLGHRNECVKWDISRFLKETLAVLFQHGLNSNHCSLMRKRCVEGASGNILVEMVKLSQYISRLSDLNFIYDWVLTSLQWGANPDIEPYPSDPIIYHSHSNIYLKPKGTQPVNQFMYEIQDARQLFEGGYVERLLMLFFNSMDHTPLFTCLSSAKIMSRFDPNRSPTFNFLQLVSGLSSQPRSLRQICRVSIYKALDRQLNLKVDALPLPVSVKRYLINIE